MVNAASPKTYPFTLRISFEERRLLQKAAQQSRRSQADIVRIGLDPVIETLRSGTTPTESMSHSD